MLKNRRAEILFVFILLVGVVFFPFLYSGITLPDELERRLTMQIGWGYANRYIIDMAKYQGRITNSLAFFISENLVFLPRNAVVVRLIQLVILITNYFLFAVVCKKLTNDKSVGMMTFSLLVIFTVFSAEHTPPNGFVALLCVPWSLYLISFLFFIKYLDGGRKNKFYIAFSNLLLLVVLFSYELFITLTPIYLVIYVNHQVKNDGTIKILDDFRGIVSFIVTSIFYLCIYTLQGHFYKTAYEGNRLMFLSVGSSIDIIIQLLRSANPCYYFFSPKYRYFWNIGFLDKFDIFRLSLFIMLVIYVLFNLLKRVKKKNDRIGKKIVIVVLVTLALCIAITLPNSLASGYQGNVNDSAFLSLPCSYFIFMLYSFLTSYILVRLSEKTIFFKLVAAILVIIIGTGIQFMGGNVLEHQAKNWNKYESVEKVLGTELVSQVNGNRLAAKDLFVVMGNRPTYLEMLVKGLYGYHMEFINDENIDCYYNISWINSKDFIFSVGDNNYLLSDELYDRVQLVDHNNVYGFISRDNSYFDNGFWIYPIFSDLDIISSNR